MPTSKAHTSRLRLSQTPYRKKGTEVWEGRRNRKTVRVCAEELILLQRASSSILDSEGLSLGRERGRWCFNGAQSASKNHKVCVRTTVTHRSSKSRHDAELRSGAQPVQKKR